MRALTLDEAVRLGSGIERPCLCPVHADTRPSASVNIVKMVWYCYTCGAHGDVGGEAIAGDPNFDLLREHLIKEQTEAQLYNEKWLNQFDAAGPGEYWLSRFSPEACEYFRLGIDPVTQNPTYPLRSPSQAVLGVVRRSGIDKGPKYLYPRVDIGTLLFGYSYFHRGDVWLVEGAADAIALWEAGVDAFAIYGSKISDHQALLLRRLEPPRIVCAFDNDDAGWDAYLRVKHEFRDIEVAKATWPKRWGKDVGELSVDQRKDVVGRLAYGEVECVGSEPCSSPAPSSRRPPILSPAMRQPSWPSRQQRTN